MFRYLDSSVVIDATDPGSSRHMVVLAALRSLASEETCVSDLGRMECLIRPSRLNSISRIASLEGFFARAVNLPLDRAVFDLVARLRADHKALKTPDALHLATALHYGCDEFWTNDLDLAKRSIGITFRTF